MTQEKSRQFVLLSLFSSSKELNKEKRSYFRGEQKIPFRTPFVYYYYYYFKSL